MYNRYIRNDNGVYTRIPQEESSPPPASAEPCSQSQPQQHPPPASPSTSKKDGAAWSDGLSGFLRHVLDQLHLDHVDTGDMLLLILLFFLFREDADEELLVALGLLLIL